MLAAAAPTLLIVTVAADGVPGFLTFIVLLTIVLTATQSLQTNRIRAALGLTPDFTAVAGLVTAFIAGFDLLAILVGTTLPPKAGRIVSIDSAVTAIAPDNTTVNPGLPG